jgi:hypothetical protein
MDYIKMDLHEVGLEGLEWTDLAEDKDRWQAPVSAEMNLRVDKMRDISSLAEDLLASQEGICPIDLVILCALLTVPCMVQVHLFLMSKYSLQHLFSNASILCSFIRLWKHISWPNQSLLYTHTHTHTCQILKWQASKIPIFAIYI